MFVGREWTSLHGGSIYFPPINSWAIDLKSDLHSAIYGSDSYMCCSLNRGLLQIELDWTHKHPLFFIWEPCWGSLDKLGGDSTDTEPPLSPKLEKSELNYDGMCLLLKIHLVTLSHIIFNKTGIWSVRGACPGLLIAIQSTERPWCLNVQSGVDDLLTLDMALQNN
jgi:hypothetical protein